MSAAGQAAIAAAVELAPAEPQQLDLLPPSRFEPGTPAHDDMIAEVRRSKAGRPPGARNLATRQAIELLKRAFGDPLLESARFTLHTPASLAAELNCTKLEAFDRLERIRADLRPYLYARLAPIDHDGQAVRPAFVMAIGAAPASSAESSPTEAPWLVDFAANQDLSHEALSHEAQK